MVAFVFASVGNRPQSFAIVRKRPQRVGHAGETKIVAKRRTVITFYVSFTKVATVTGIGGVVVAKRRTVVTFGVVSGLRVSKVSTVTGIRGGRGRETQNRRHFWIRLGSSRLKSVNSHRDRGVVVAKRRTVVTFGLASGERRKER